LYSDICRKITILFTNKSSERKIIEKSLFTTLTVTDNIREYDLKIYNRWGELIFYSTDPVIYWDGTYKNANCADGVYYYQFMMRDMDGKFRSQLGTVSVVR